MVLLVRYGELSLKSPYVRRQLEDRLATNVREMFAAEAVECVVKTERGRLFVHATDEVVAVRLLTRVFGIVSVSPALETSSGFDVLVNAVVEYARGILRPGMTFAIRPRRSGEHPYTSQELARALGQAVRDAVPGVRVDLENPDREIRVEVRGPRAFVSHEVVEGPGGLPVGSQGEVLSVADDETGMVATWLVMRRGCRARVLGLEPFVAALRRWDPRLEDLADMPRPELPRLSAEKGIPIVLPPARDGTNGGRTPFRLFPHAGLTGPEIAALGRRIRDA